MFASTAPDELPAPYLALDIGGTSTRIARVANTTAGAHDPDASDTDDPPPYAHLARFATDERYADEVEHIAEAAAGVRCAAVGISLGAQLAPDGRSVLTAPNLRDYIGRPFADDLAARLGCPVRMAHDGVCGVLAERTYGALAGEDRCAYVTLSTGTGAGIALRTGPTALAISIQIGHQIFPGNTLRCLCGQVGCLETLTGGRQLALRLGRDPSTIDDPAFWEEYARTVATALINLAQLTRVAVVALGGGIALSHPELVAWVGEAVRSRISDATLAVRAACLGEEAPLLGAALLPTLAPGGIVH